MSQDAKAITVSKTFRLSIKGQEFELTEQEAKALRTAIDAAIGTLPTPAIPYQPAPSRPQRPPMRPNPWENEDWRRFERPSRPQIICRTLPSQGLLHAGS